MVAAAGGLKNGNPLLEVHQQAGLRISSMESMSVPSRSNRADEASVLAVMCETRKLREKGLA
jgi:hypothetical protein